MRNKEVITSRECVQVTRLRVTSSEESGHYLRNNKIDYPWLIIIYIDFVQFNELDRNLNRNRKKVEW